MFTRVITHPLSKPYDTPIAPKASRPATEIPTVMHWSITANATANFYTDIIMYI